MVLPSDLQIHLVIQQVNDYRFTHAIWNASLACLAYDYLLTLDDEVRYMWGRRLSRARLLFWVNRYWAIINIIIYNIFLNWPNPHDAVYVQLPAALLASKHLYRVSPCATFDTLGANFLSSGSRIPHSSPTSQSEVGPPDGLSGIHITGSLTRKPSLPAILTLRVHAIYSCNRKILYILLTLLCAELITEIILIVFISDRFTVLHLPPTLPGCAPTNIVPYAWSYWIPMTVFESALFILSAAKAIQYLINAEFRTQTPNLAYILVRDSMIYFGSVLALILINLIIWKASRPSLFAAFPSTVPAFHSILGCRMLLNMHIALEHTGDGNTALYNTMIPLGPLKFTPLAHSEQATELLGTTA
ncbi:hypothetical protein BC629DRAFT_1593127 [Irpex lacteus]|nr:hypothetical protein BC629DRAFT_1593127 [Irpex lacteus]